MDLLVVDDDPLTRALLEEALADSGHRLHQAADGESGWQALQAMAFPIVICDWNLPGLSGLDLCRRVRAAGGREYTWFILITSYHGGRIAEAMDAGVDDFLPKPLDLDHLAVRLRVAARVLDFHRQIGILQGLLPICMYCKKIRDDRKFWVDVESYFKAQAGAGFTHSLCPECHAQRVQPQLDALKGGATGGELPKKPTS